MVNHGVTCLGANMKQAFYRCLIVEDAAKSLVAACAVGKPQFLTPQQEADLMSLDAPHHRIKMMEEK
jgi:ribulose-5-phosphate 4-epimerase/fuculose-1-phosphate aldolase